MVALAAMPTDIDDEPTIEVSEISLLELLAFMDDLGPSSGVNVERGSEAMAWLSERGVAPCDVSGLTLNLSEAAEGLFDPVDRDVQAAILTILRTVARSKRRAER